jgi:3-hydroxyacyl-CoA dehydrogenase
VANRLGAFWLWSALDAALACGLEVETADAVLRSPFGAPVGVFAFLDLVGIDLASEALASLQNELPADDALQAFRGEPGLINEMIRLGRTGRKAGAGFVRKGAEGDPEVLDLHTLDYRKARRSTASPLAATTENLRSILADDGPVGRFAWSVMSRTLAYAAALAPSVVDSPALVDVAMREGYGWSQGPFALIDAIGPSWLVARMRRDRTPVPPALAAMAGLPN